MKKSKFYFQSEDAEICWPLEYHLDIARFEGVYSVELFEAIPTKLSGWFWCKHIAEVGEDGYCGKVCNGYKPRNGKSGMCKYRSNTLYTHGNKVTFNI